MFIIIIPLSKGTIYSIAIDIMNVNTKSFFERLIVIFMQVCNIIFDFVLFRIAYNQLLIRNCIF